LLGYDPQADYERLKHELEGRRLNLAAPPASLLLRKPAAELPHGGGKRLAAGTEAYGTVLAWIRAGAPYGDPKLRLDRIEVAPADLLLAPGGTATLRVTARYSNGSRRDVSSLALFNANDEAVAAVDETGRVTARGRGIASVMIRFQGRVTAARIGIPFQDRAVAMPAGPESPVDRPVFAELARLRLPPSPAASDTVLLRRLYLDLIGALPVPDEVRTFQHHVTAIGSGPARGEKIRELLARPEFTDYWTLKLADWLLINGRRLGDREAERYYEWLREQVARNVPLDRMVRDLLLAQGDARTVGPANFYRMNADPRERAEFASRTFLGVRVQCARCHDHPFDRWSQDDYYGLAAFFARVKEAGGRVVISERGEVQHPKNGSDVPPRLLLTAVPAEVGPDRRLPLAAWLTAPENPFFAASLANRVWKQLLGRGLFEPVDDLRPTNPPSNPALLKALASELVRGGFDLRKLVETIVTSRTYQLSSRTDPGNRTDERLFSHAYLKPLTGAVLADALAQATGIPERYGPGLEARRAVQVLDPSVPSVTLDVFGRCMRNNSCESGGETGGGLAQALHLLNGESLHEKVRSGVSRGISGLPDREAVDELYLRTLSRLPLPAERDHWERLLRGAADRAELLEDLLWALLNSREFSFNH
jgi:hypothetical protein